MLKIGIAWYIVIFIGSLLLGASIHSSAVLAIFIAFFAAWYSKPSKSGTSFDTSNLSTNERKTTGVDTNESSMDLEEMWKSKFGDREIGNPRIGNSFLRLISANKFRKLNSSVSGLWILFGTILYKSAETSRTWYEVLPAGLSYLVKIGYGLGIVVFKEAEYDSISLAGYMYFILSPIVIITLICLTYEWIRKD